MRLPSLWGFKFYFPEKIIPEIYTHAILLSIYKWWLKKIRKMSLM